MAGLSFLGLAMPQSYISPRFSAIDSNGRPLVGGQLSTFINGTTTPEATYQDAGGLAANTNPIILDARGEAVIFLTEGITYTFELKDAAGALVWTQDGIVSSGDSTGLPIYLTPPTSDVGSPIYITGMGWANWDGSKYVSDFSTGFGNGAYSHKNVVVNGDFSLWFGGTSIGPITAASGSPYTAEQWRAFIAGTASVTVARQTASADYGQGRVGPYTARITSNAGITPAAGDRNQFRQPIEGYNVLALALGTLWGGWMTLSFFVKGSIAGTYSVAFLNSGSPGYRSYVSNYTIDVAGTWELKTVTVPIDQSGVANWDRTNGIGLQLVFDLGSGSTYEGAVDTWASTETVRTTGSVRLVSTNAATLEFSNVQLEYGAKRTPFEYLPMAIKQELCERYYFVLVETSTGLMPSSNSTSRQLNRSFPTTMRAAPTITLNNPSATPSSIIPNVNGIRLVWAVGDTTTIVSIDGYIANARM